MKSCINVLGIIYIWQKKADTNSLSFLQFLLHKTKQMSWVITASALSCEVLSLCVEYLKTVTCRSPRLWFTFTDWDRLVLPSSFLFYRPTETCYAVPSVTYTAQHVNSQVTATNIRQPGWDTLSYFIAFQTHSKTRTMWFIIYTCKATLSFCANG